MKIAIRYYTQTGNTKKLAQAIAEALGVEAKDITCPLEEKTDILFLCNSVYWAGIDRIYYANTRDDAAAADFADGFIYEELDKPLAERSLPIVPLLRDEALHTFRRWQEKADKTVY